MNLEWFIGILITILFGFLSFLPFLISSHKERVKRLQHISNSLHDCLSALVGEDDADLLESPHLIPTYGQKESPHDSTGVLTYSRDRYKLIPTILSAIMPSKGELTNRHFRYMILGGSGMGKSTFAASLCYAYLSTRKYRRKGLPLDIFAINLDTNNLADIQLKIDEFKKIAEPSKSILVLDSLDENRDAINDYETFMTKLENITDSFRAVIITCRTQFYERKQAEPTEGATEQPHRSKMKLEVHYISPFTQKEAEDYLIGKFGLGSSKYVNAHKLMGMTDDLMGRPLLLSYMDDLLDLAAKAHPTNAQIYYEIIRHWLQKEIKFDPLKSNITLNELYRFTKSIAEYIYSQENRYITKDQFENFLRDSGFNASPFSFKGRTLLNRRNNGDIKFAHRSFLEFFIAVNSLEHPESQYNPDGLDMALTFAHEMYTLYLEDPSSFIKQFSEIDIAESPLCLHDTKEETITDILADWKKQLKEVPKEEKGDINLHYMSLYWNYLVRGITYQTQDILTICTRIMNKHMEDNILDVYGYVNFDWLASKRLAEVQAIMADGDITNLKEKDIQLLQSKSNSIKDWIDKAELCLGTTDLFTNYEARYTVTFVPFMVNFPSDQLVCSLGYGFVQDDKEVLAEAKLVYERQNTGASLYIFKKTNSLDEQVHFIQSIIQEDINWRTNNRIVVGFYNRDKRFFYVLDDKTRLYSESQIRHCLGNLSLLLPF